jgi:hypothetical protein
VTYLGLSLNDLNDLFFYDSREKVVKLRRTGKSIGTDSGNGLIYKMRVENKVLSISLGKLTHILYHQSILDKYDKIKYKDGDYTNLDPDNLVVVRKVLHSSREDRVDPMIFVDRRIFYNSNSGQYVVRRGSKQAIYRTFSKDEAISIRNEWESDNSIHKWDKTVEKYAKYL